MLNDRGQQTSIASRHLEIRIRWEHLEKRTSANQVGDFPGQESQASSVILPEQRRHSSQRHRALPEHCRVRAAGVAATDEWPAKPAALRLANDRLARY